MTAAEMGFRRRLFLRKATAVGFALLCVLAVLLVDVTAETAWAVYARRKEIRGLRMVYEPKYLRFFEARFEPL